MTRILLSLVILITPLSQTYADLAQDAVKSLDLQILPTVSEDFEPSDLRDREIERRKKAQVQFNKDLENYLRSSMSEAELKSIITFAQSEAGKKLFKTFHSEGFEKISANAIDLYQKTRLEN